MTMKILWVLPVFLLSVSGRLTHPDPFLDAILAAEEERKLLESGYSTTVQNDTHICFGHDLGCFSWEETKFTGHFPEDPGMAKINTSFHLYERGPKSDIPLMMFYENETSYNNIEALKKTDRPLFVLAHGFGGTGRAYWVVAVKNAILNIMDANILSVDWKRGSALPLYNQAAANTMSVGRATGRMMAEFVRIYGYSPKNIHYIGFSLGAQLGAFASRHFTTLTGTKISRMTVLDAAAPGFEKYGVHVNKDDSEFTIGVHTSAGDSIVTGRVGMVAPVGHIDFYPNGGANQPGCRFYEFKCHHERAHAYFVEAIVNSEDPKACKFYGRNCSETWEEVVKDKCTVVGDLKGEMSLTPSGESKMYLKTNSAAPFCLQ